MYKQNFFYIILLLTTLFLLLFTSYYVKQIDRNLTTNLEATQSIAEQLQELELIEE